MADNHGGTDFGLIITWIGTLAFGAIAVYAMSAILA